MGYHPLVLRNTASSLFVPITIIFNQSLDKGELPQAWLDANVTPLHKKALDWTLPTHFTHISVGQNPRKGSQVINYAALFTKQTAI